MRTPYMALSNKIVAKEASAMHLSSYNRFQHRWWANISQSYSHFTVLLWPSHVCLTIGATQGSAKSWKEEIVAGKMRLWTIRWSLSVIVDNAINYVHYRDVTGKSLHASYSLDQNDRAVAYNLTQLDISLSGSVLPPDPPWISKSWRCSWFKCS